MLPGTYIIPPSVSGDSWDGIPSIRIRRNGQVPPFEIRSVRMQFRNTKGALGCELSSADGTIKIESYAGWHLSIPAQALRLSAGKWLYDLEITDAAGVVNTYMAGHMFLNPEITR